VSLTELREPITLYDHLRAHDLNPETLDEAMRIVLEVERLVRQGKLRLPYRPRTFVTCYNLLYEIQDALDMKLR